MKVVENISFISYSWSSPCVAVAKESINHDKLVQKIYEDGFVRLEGILNTTENKEESFKETKISLALSYFIVKEYSLLANNMLETQKRITVRMLVKPKLFKIFLDLERKIIEGFFKFPCRKSNSMIPTFMKLLKAILDRQKNRRIDDITRDEKEKQAFLRIITNFVRECDFDEIVGVQHKDLNENMTSV